MAIKPLKKPEWASGGSAEIIEPGPAKKLLGWIVEKPPFQFFNWLFNTIYLWVNYFEESTDDLEAGLTQEIEDRGTAVSDEAATRAATDTALLNKLQAAFDAIVGAAAYATDATMAAAITRLSAGARILVLDSFALAAPVVMSKANMEIVLKPGVIISAGAATTGFTISAAGCIIRGGKISGFTNGIDVGASGAQFMARDIWFASNTTEVNDPNDLASIVGCI